MFRSTLLDLLFAHSFMMPHLIFWIVTTNLGQVLSHNDHCKIASHQFSGFYLPNTTYAAENYAGSWLISRLRLFNIVTMENS
jgi:hypothetical protein